MTKSQSVVTKEPSIEELVSNHDAFNSFVYSTAEYAQLELKRRWSDESIPEPRYLPPHLQEGFKALYSVCTITSNYGVRRYLSIADILNLEPLIFERKEDKYVPQNNEWKYSLGKMCFVNGRNKNGELIFTKSNIINFNEAVGQKISSIKTLWGQTLIDFHHELFFSTFPHLSREKNIFDNSDWYFEVGGTLNTYYEAFLTLTIKHGILFENFLLDKRELAFTRDIFLPAFINVQKKTGLKPLIVALEPTDMEGEQFWISHPSETAKLISNKLQVMAQNNV